MDYFTRWYMESGVFQDCIIKNVYEFFNMMTQKVKKAAGSFIIAKNSGTALFNFRTKRKSHPHTWGLWGGMTEYRENIMDTVLREIEEEIGFMPPIIKFFPFDVNYSDDGKFVFYTTIALVEEEFLPILNNESDGYCWVKIGAWPSPLHPGIEKVISNTSIIEQLKKIL